ncbi:hypothetical protein Celaphus_00000612 [Cervus elaphus hippelaphus]|uniref:Tudor domain-containing protein n=1 Tax=Cervus elaphus hippelaphus TaxID=46360 RepID=A0A212D8R8_CEREH|nr:hypothetical protein Celaphus_00000612 [Cervus elaphus hippelaphus]
MTIQLRSLFPLALPGVLALLGWWWFFARKKEPLDSHERAVEAGAVVLRAGPATQEALPVEDARPGAASPLPERELCGGGRPSLEPSALLRAHPVCRRSESSGSLPNPTDTRLRPGARKEVELALAGDEAKAVPLECPLPAPKGLPFPHEAVEVCKREAVLGRPAAPAEKPGPGEKAREKGGAEGTGDAVLGENSTPCLCSSSCAGRGCQFSKWDCSDGNSMDSVDSCCGLRKPDGFQNAQAGSNPKKVDLIIWEIEVPKHLVGRLIGKQGRYVSFLKQTSGAKIYISTLPYTQNIQVCHIEGSQQHVDKALSLIGKKFKELNLTNIYAPPLPSLALPSLPMTSWLMLPDGVTVEVIVVNQVNAGHLFVQQHTHPTFHALRSLDQQMYLCYSQPGIPTLPTPVEITVICAAPGADGAWWRAQVVAAYEDTNEVEIRYVDYGGYKRVKVDVLRQIR